MLIWNCFGAASGDSDWPSYDRLTASQGGRKPTAIEQTDRSDRFLPLVSNRDKDALPIAADARVFSSFLHAGKTEHYELETGRGIYLYVLEGGPITVNNVKVPPLGSAMVTGEKEIDLTALQDAELLLVEVKK